jgi:hypothetical protein
MSKRSLLVLCLFLVPLASCAMDSGDEPLPVGSIDEALGGKACLSTADCSKDKRCTTEIGECSDPRGKCAGVECDFCYGICRPLELCGDVTCPEGDVCCSAECGICTAPGEACICETPGEVLSG